MFEQCTVTLLSPPVVLVTKYTSIPSDLKNSLHETSHVRDMNLSLFESSVLLVIFPFSRGLYRSTPMLHYLR
jgi:hypothetical protein